ncbi:nucleolar transcription factor 1-B-like isoform X2 [Genypterus blacodes]|uniref:nucleolar transcription factor 1-B-like isoform X2 n=1 Tax=Genypterus blacodes TaxID=154954 RepID=UPI003F76C613
MSSEWTAEDMLTLLQAMRANVPKRSQPSTYRKEQRRLDWNNVAFHPHSAQACQKKWKQILQKMRRVRSLTELLDEAEDTLAEPLQNGKIHPELPKRPKPPNAIFNEENFANLQKTHPKLSQAQLMKLSNQKYNDLPAVQKAPYIQKFQLSAKEYQKKWGEFRKKYDHVKTRRTKTPSLDEDDRNNNEDGKTKAHNPPPKPPKNGYVLFCNEAMASSTNESSSCCEQWRKLSDTQKKEYKTRCEQLKKEYTEMMKEHLHDIDEEQPQQSPEKNDVKRPEQGKKRKCRADKERIDKEEQRPTKRRTSDSEDEALEDSSSDGDTYYFNSDEEEGDGRRPWYCPL